ncbi:DDHD domain-containing protein [Lipomyces japonicus]|uniref:DDHD domain-containing protein n=1 Tax=Lipomyces japonicus TaxID=56871 RepID=UPI0034D01F99
MHSAADHQVPYRQRLSLKDLPPDTPTLNIRWYFATDVPKNKPFADKDWKPPKSPSKFVPFSAKDSRELEAIYQKSDDPISPVPVNEDHLFQVDIQKRELSPIYWNGPSYDVRRGTWFYSDSNTLKPCDENLANQIEEGYLKKQPFKKIVPETSTTDSTVTHAKRVRVDTLVTAETDERHDRKTSFTESITSALYFKSGSSLPARATKPETKSRSSSTNRSRADSVDNGNPTTQAVPDVNTWPLYGPHMGKYVVFSNDAAIAWIISDDFYGKFSSTIYQRLTAGTNMGGIKIVRGWSKITKSTTSKKERSPSSSAVHSDAEEEQSIKFESITSDPTAKLVDAIRSHKQKEAQETDEAKDNEVLKEQMEMDYYADKDEDPNRPIEHLVLCVHGIGQKLGQRMESVNFVGDINTLRKTMKSVYSNSADLPVLNGEPVGDAKSFNSRVQVLPVCWRHNIHFGLQREDGVSNRKEQDIGEVDDSTSTDNAEADNDVASLQDITVDSVPALRGIISEVLLDILLYYQPNYREKIMRNVTNECNRIYHLFCKHNPSFNGRVSLIGHSLGAAITFDILCRQSHDAQSASRNVLSLDFNADSFFGLGSPVGLFQMLKGKTIAPRSISKSEDQPLSPLRFDLDDPFESKRPISATVSVPKVEDVYNVFHPADPIAYRMEPLVVKRMAELKPQSIPTTRRGLNNQIANLAELTSRVAQSASNMWSSMASGLASTILNKSLGYDSDSTAAAAAGSGTSISTNGVTNDDSKFQQDLATITHEHETNEVETLYSKFQKDSVKLSKEAVKLSKEAETYSRLQKDDAMIRGLNYTGRIDFALVEGYMDITILASMGSHLGYFRDPDVANFLIAQLLARPLPKRMKSVGKIEGQFQSMVG